MMRQSSHASEVYRAGWGDGSGHFLDSSQAMLPHEFNGDGDQPGNIDGEGEDEGERDGDRGSDEKVFDSMTAGSKAAGGDHAPLPSLASDAVFAPPSPSSKKDQFKESLLSYSEYVSLNKQTNKRRKPLRPPSIYIICLCAFVCARSHVCMHNKEPLSVTWEQRNTYCLAFQHARPFESSDESV